MLTHPATAPAPPLTSRTTLASGNILGALLAFELVLSALASWPEARHFVFTAFEDFGGTVNVQRLLDLGLLPGVDFYYPYGLLPLLVARGWFGLFGVSTIAYVALNILCEAIVGVGLGRCAGALRLSPPGVLFVALAAPLIVPFTYFNVTHAVEMVLLVHALAEHARGRRQIALALVTACAFVKPSMAYIYGFVLVLLIVRLNVQRRSTPAVWSQALRPAFVTGICVTTVLIYTYGISALLKVQFPTGSRRSYELIGYGFFNGTGRNFWRPAGASLNYYLGTFAGVWLTMTCLLVAGSLLALWQSVVKQTSLSLSNEFAATTAVLHMSFICLFFGNAGSWSYYAFALVLGSAAILNAYRWAGALSWCLAFMLILVHARMLPDRLKVWRLYSPSPETAGLWATQPQREEWKHVLEMTRDRNPLILSPSGCAEMLFPNLHGTDNWWTSNVTLPIMPNTELKRIKKRIDAASTIIVAMITRDIVQSPQIKESFGKFKRTWHGAVFDVYSRVQPSTT